MNRILAATLLAAITLPLGACTDDYAYGGRVAYGSTYAYDGYYDGYYGPIHDGYWGNDGYFYYRRGDGDRAYIRGDHDHFRRDWSGGDRYRPLRGQMTPQQGYRMPHWSGDHDRGDHGWRDHDHHD